MSKPVTMLFKKMQSIELSVTDSNGIDGEVIADVDDGRLYEFEIVQQEMEEGQEIEFAPSWSDVERAVESNSRKRKNWER